jgi:tRNA pseudouridine38-40 synthase
MRHAAAALIGEHDFAAFRAAGCTAKTTRRRIDEIAIAAAGEPGELGQPGQPDQGGEPAGNAEPPLVALDVRGNAFLRNMVRILAGTLVEVGAGRRRAEQVAEILASKDRTRAGITAPAHGLELVSVGYDGTRQTDRKSGVR